VRQQCGCMHTLLAHKPSQWIVKACASLVQHVYGLVACDLPWACLLLCPSPLLESKCWQ
jgi:hypothetical protein